MDLTMDFAEKQEDKILVEKSGVTLFESAYTKLKNVLQHTEKALRITLEPSGCAGVSYVAQLDTPTPQDVVIDFGDNVRLMVSDEKRFPSDTDPSQYYSDWDFLEGLHLQYEESIMTSRFVMENPNAVRGCSCGISFKPRGYGGKPKSCATN